MAELKTSTQDVQRVLCVTSPLIAGAEQQERTRNSPRKRTLRSRHTSQPAQDGIKAVIQIASIEKIYQICQIEQARQNQAEVLANKGLFLPRCPAIPHDRIPQTQEEV